MLKSWEAAYIAGMIDSEGTISLKNTKADNGSAPVITISSLDLNMLVFIQSILPGSLYSNKQTINGKEIYRYTIEIKQRENVYHALQQIQPFLRVTHKKQQITQVLKKLRSSRLFQPSRKPNHLYVLEQA